MSISINFGGDIAAQEPTRCPYCKKALDYDKDNIVLCPHCGKTVFYIWSRSQFFTQNEYLSYVQEQSYEEMERVSKRFNFVTAKYKQLGQNLLAAELQYFVENGNVKKSIKVRDVADDYFNESIEWIVDDYEYVLPSTRALAYLVSLGYRVDRLITKTETSFLIDMMKLNPVASRHPFSPERYGRFTLDQVRLRLSEPFQLSDVLRSAQVPQALPSSRTSTLPAAQAPRALPVPPPVVEHVRDIQSADLSQLGSERLFQVRDKILSAYEEKHRRMQKFQAIQNEFHRQTRMWFGMKKLLAPYFGELSEYLQNLDILKKQVDATKEWLDKCRLRINSKLAAPKEASWKIVAESFQKLAKTPVFDVVATKEVAGKVSDVIVPVQFSIQCKEIVECSYPVLFLQNANGSDLYIYPNFIIMENGETVAVIDLAELKIETPKAGTFLLKTDSGLNEMYQAKESSVVSGFIQAIQEYQVYLK